MLVPTPVIVEMCWLVEERPDIEAALLEAIAAGEFEHVPTGAPDIARMAQLVRSYGDLPLDVVDASVIAIAERLKLTDVGHPGPAPLHSRPAGVALRLREAHERLLADVRSVRVCGWRTLEG